MDPLRYALRSGSAPPWGPVTLRDGRVAHLRPIRPDDAVRLRRMFDRLSADTVYLRFFSPVRRPSEDALRYLASVDHRDRLAVVAESADEIVGVARCDRTPDDDRAEVAVVVEDAWQGRGLARLLLGRLGAEARLRGIVELVATVLPENRVALDLAATSLGAVLTSEDGVVAVRIPLEADAPGVRTA
jgi:GNAT superfamily N-acetyltransferase